MALYKIADLYPNYEEEIFAGNDIKDFSFYGINNEKVGSIHDIIVDETGYVRYLVIDTGFWIFGKKILLPIGRANIDYSRQRVYSSVLTKEQVENLPEYDDDMTIDFDNEEKVRSIYRTPNQANLTSYNRDNYSYNRDRELYETNEQNHQDLKLYEERLVANKDRFRTGTVSVGKNIETETAKVSVPVEKERVIIERNSPNKVTPVAANDVDFQEGEVARVEVYEETANIEKQTFVREEVSVKKEVKRDSVEAKENLRREELDIDVEGKPNVKRR
ncbi:MAG: DUF2382 domain-containing protein [Nostocaceae cyanobacterium]|nr:DUF2382 domain-containing protein [Nostocaceae cyanobacterium]